MQYTTNMALKKPDLADTANIADLNANADALDGHRHDGGAGGLGVKALQAGTLAARPAAGISGQVYLARDQSPPQLFVDNGSAWTQIGATASVPAARVYHSANQSIANTTDVALAFNSERFDTDMIHDVTVNNTRLTCKTAGKYLIVAQARFALNATGFRRLQLKVNGSATIAQFNVAASSADATELIVTTLWEMAVNDYVEVLAYQTSGGALNIEQGNAFSPEFGMVQVA
jgi:hypothetical protein